jgi:hypothetical protein
MGAVFEARQVDLGRTVALKVLNPEFAEDPDFRARFVREARMLATLDSPHIIQVYDAGEHDGEFYIATQLVNGRDLLQRVRDEGALPAAAALRIVGQMASALADAHDSGVLHRDVKPSNILIRDSRADYFAYLCDFGIARHTDSSHTRTGGVLGTLSYLAPECHAGADATVRSDLYSLGCVLWAALTGSAPYERTSEYQVALAHMQEPIPTYDGDSPAARQINEILRISMAKQPTDRFLSASAMHTALVEAEEAARGLRRVDGAAGIRGTSESDRTQLRTAQPALTDVKAASERGRFGRFSRSSRVLAVWVAAMLVLVALAGTAVALLRQNDAGSTAANREAQVETSGASRRHTERPTARLGEPFDHSISGFGSLDRGVTEHGRGHVLGCQSCGEGARLPSSCRAYRTQDGVSVDGRRMLTCRSSGCRRQGRGLSMQLRHVRDPLFTMAHRRGPTQLPRPEQSWRYASTLGSPG